MTKPPNYGHLDYIPIMGNTKEWFKRDWETIKKSVKITVKNIIWIFLLTFILSAVVIYLITFKIDLLLILVFSVIFLPIISLGFLIFYILNTKGYDIANGGGN